MPRRLTVPDDIFRPTAVPPPAAAVPAEPAVAVVEEPVETPGSSKGRQSSGRVKHDEKMTVYVTSDELLDLEHARLELRRHHGLGVDRGRIVRAAIAMALADLDQHGADSALVARLAQD
ncbi:hypothetical protein [Nocardioides marmoribigeumensis]|uniref:Ribbon-helix-helix protein, CopG family n=1 Tax=Nocardioides marmoribigeumensis TaxID=433649 RepID=A0ABU2BSG5_9ACTN|nr:hypothetical protein [Nocardioides marmoribigeumensis]MDR7360929.1 hypothetical protein [Nocardioides marmoribigeumensis]